VIDAAAVAEIRVVDDDLDGWLARGRVTGTHVHVHAELD
jgi:hypothetical protein